MPKSREYTPSRRFMMQAIMWVILGATVALAALVSSHRRSALEVKLGAPIMVRHLTVSLPKGWEPAENRDERSSLLITTTEPEDEESIATRTLRIVREPIASHSNPLSFVFNRLESGDRPKSRSSEISIDGCNGILLVAARPIAIRSPQEFLSRGGGRLMGTLIIAGTLTPSGRGVAVELETDGPADSSDIALVERIAGTIKLDDEPALADESQITLGNGIRITVPNDFASVQRSDPLRTDKELRVRSATEWKAIDLVPMVMLPKDGGETLLTMLSLYGSEFEGAIATQQEGGFWRIEHDAGRSAGFPLKAFASSKNGVGFLAVFKGGSDDSWIDTAWQSMNTSSSFPEQTPIDAMIAAGADQAKALTGIGLDKLLPNPQEEWWLDCIGDSRLPLGWRHFTPGIVGDKIEMRLLFDNRRLHKINYEWQGKADLTTYRAAIEYSVEEIENEASSVAMAFGFNANLRAGKIELQNRSRGEGKPITYPAPDNYLPGGWLEQLLGKLSSDSPIILRTDSFIEYAYARPTDLLTVMIRPDTSAPRTLEGAPRPMRCLAVEFSGSGERSLWYFRADGSLDSVDYPESLRRVHCEEKDIIKSFPHDQSMRP